MIDGQVVAVLASIFVAFCPSTRPYFGLVGYPVF